LNQPPLSSDLNAEIDRELEIAKARWGETFELKCLEGSRGDTLDNEDILRMNGPRRAQIRLGQRAAKRCPNRGFARKPVSAESRCL
jgi:hypothetical protein